MNKKTASVLLISAAVAFLLIFVYEFITFGITYAYWWLMLFLACYVGFGYLKAQIQAEEDKPSMTPKKVKKRKKR